MEPIEIEARDALPLDAWEQPFDAAWPDADGSWPWLPEPLRRAPASILSVVPGDYDVLRTTTGYRSKVVGIVSPWLTYGARVREQKRSLEKRIGRRRRDVNGPDSQLRAANGSGSDLFDGAGRLRSDRHRISDLTSLADLDAESARGGLSAALVQRYWQRAALMGWVRFTVRMGEAPSVALATAGIVWEFLRSPEERGWGQSAMADMEGPDPQEYLRSTRPAFYAIASRTLSASFDVEDARVKAATEATADALESYQKTWLDEVVGARDALLRADEALSAVTILRRSLSTGPSEEPAVGTDSEAELCAPVLSGDLKRILDILATFALKHDGEPGAPLSSLTFERSPNGDLVSSDLWERKRMNPIMIEVDFVYLDIVGSKDERKSSYTLKLLRGALNSGMIPPEYSPPAKLSAKDKPEWLRLVKRHVHLQLGDRPSGA